MLVKKALSVAVAFALTKTIGGSSHAQSLREQADKAGMLVGAAVAPSLFSEAPYASTLAREFNMLEPENVMKWAAIRPHQNTFNFKPGDQVDSRFYKRSQGDAVAFRPKLCAEAGLQDFTRRLSTRA